MAKIMGSLKRYRSFANSRIDAVHSTCKQRLTERISPLFTLIFLLFRLVVLGAQTRHLKSKYFTPFLISTFVFLSSTARSDIHCRQSIDLPSQPLSSALTEIGKTFKLSILYPSNLLSGIQSKSIKGNLTPEEILIKLLRDTGYTAKFKTGRVVAIIPLEIPDTEEKVATNTSTTTSFSEEIIVLDKPTLGSRIGTNGINNSAPVEIISAPELAASGAQTLVEFLKFTPAIAGNSISTTVSNGGNGTADVTLRGLPATNTLVLINGRRVAPDGIAGDSVDINTIAPGIVERVEILTDGASALYGSDAIAGVVNIVLRKAYDGIQLEQYIGQSSRGDLNTSTTNIIAGHDFDRGNVFVAASLYEQDALFSKDRSFSANADARSRGGVDLRSSSTPNARITLADGQVVTLDQSVNGDFLPGTSPEQFRAVTNEDLFNFNEFTSSTSPLTRKNLHTAFTYQLSNSTLLSIDASYAQTESEITLAQLPLFSSFENPTIFVSADNVFNPFGTDILDVRRRFVELGNRTQDDDSKTYRYAMSLESSNQYIDWQLEGYWTRTDSRQTRRGLADADRVTQALGAAEGCLGECVPLNVFGPAGSITQDQIDFIATTETVEGTSDLRGINGLVKGDLLALPAGISEYALGVEWRYESTRLSASTVNDAVELVAGNETPGANGGRRIFETFFEWHLPILKNTQLIKSLDIELATRYSRYSDFGNNTSPKLGVKAQVNTSVLLRATLGRGFRAPSLGELHLEGLQSQAFLTDPCANPENVGVLPGCNLLSDDTRFQFQTVFTGNENLKPEKSQNLTLGLVWAPTHIPDFRFSADWFHIDQKNIIASNPQALVDLNAEEGLFSNSVIRDELGNITQVLSLNTNLGTRVVTGFDITWDYKAYEGSAGQISIGGNAVYLQKYRQRTTQSAEAIEFAGTFTDSAAEGQGPLPEWKASLGIQWKKEQWELNYNLNYIDSLIETIPRSELTRQIDSWITHNAQLNYRPQNTGLSITLGIENIFDTEPPFAASSLTDNFDGFAYDPRQRFIYGRLTYNF